MLKLTPVSINTGLDPSCFVSEQIRDHLFWGFVPPLFSMERVLISVWRSYEQFQDQYITLANFRNDFLAHCQKYSTISPSIAFLAVHWFCFRNLSTRLQIALRWGTGASENAVASNLCIYHLFEICVWREIHVLHLLKQYCDEISNIKNMIRKMNSNFTNTLSYRNFSS